MIDKSVLELGPTAAEIAAAETEKFISKEQKSTSFHETVAGISDRGTALGDPDRGQSMTDERKTYKEALARAEAEAAFGEFAEVKTGYRESHTAGEQTGREGLHADGTNDEYGGAFPGYENG